MDSGFNTPAVCFVLHGKTLIKRLFHFTEIRCDILAHAQQLHIQ